MHENLQRQFGSENIRFLEGHGGLTKIVISTRAADAEIYLHGAHLTHFQLRGAKPVLYLSSASAFRADKPIRGGVPICWPWFGPKAEDPKLPMHGFARVGKWTVEATSQIDADRARITLRLESDDVTHALWPQDFVLRFAVTVGPELEMELESTNRSAAGVLIGEALHSYFLVGDISQISVRGLTGTTYFDKVAGDRKLESRDPIRLSSETDNVYLNTRAPVVIDDPVFNRRIRIEKAGSNSTVLWNPFEAKAATMADLAANGWRNFVCVETVNTAENSVMLAAGATHTVRTLVKVN